MFYNQTMSEQIWKVLRKYLNQWSIPTAVPLGVNTCAWWWRLVVVSSRHIPVRNLLLRVSYHPTWTTNQPPRNGAYHLRTTERPRHFGTTGIQVFENLAIRMCRRVDQWLVDNSWQLDLFFVTHESWHHQKKTRFHAQKMGTLEKRWQHSTRKNGGKHEV